MNPNRYYAASEWCLNELAKIMECNRSLQQIVLPIFYDVDPSEVRNLDEGTQDLNESFGEVFARGKERFGEDKVQHWKAALNEAANLAGWYLQDAANWYVICSLILNLLQRRCFDKLNDVDCMKKLY